MATLPSCDFASGPRRASREMDSRQRHRGTEEKSTEHEQTMYLTVFIYLLASSLCLCGSILFPAMRIADGEHCPEDAVPRLGLHHCLVREHATVPADVFEFLRRIAVGVAHPEAGVVRDL